MSKKEPIALENSPRSVECMLLPARSDIHGNRSSAVEELVIHRCWLLGDQDRVPKL